MFVRGRNGSRARQLRNRRILLQPPRTTFPLVLLHDEENAVNRDRRQDDSNVTSRTPWDVRTYMGAQAGRAFRRPRTNLPFDLRAIREHRRPVAGRAVMNGSDYADTLADVDSDMFVRNWRLPSPISWHPATAANRPVGTRAAIISENRPMSSRAAIVSEYDQVQQEVHENPNGRTRSVQVQTDDHVSLASLVASGIHRRGRTPTASSSTITTETPCSTGIRSYSVPSTSTESWTSSPMFKLNRSEGSVLGRGAGSSGSNNNRQAELRRVKSDGALPQMGRNAPAFDKPAAACSDSHIGGSGCSPSAETDYLARLADYCVSSTTALENDGDGQHEQPNESGQDKAFCVNSDSSLFENLSGAFRTLSCSEAESTVHSICSSRSSMNCHCGCAISGRGTTAPNPRGSANEYFTAADQSLDNRSLCTVSSVDSVVRSHYAWDSDDEDSGFSSSAASSVSAPLVPAKWRLDLRLLALGSFDYTALVSQFLQHSPGKSKDDLICDLFNDYRLLILYWKFGAGSRWQCKTNDGKDGKMK